MEQLLCCFSRITHAFFHEEFRDLSFAIQIIYHGKPPFLLVGLVVSLHYNDVEMLLEDFQPHYETQYR